MTFQTSKDVKASGTTGALCQSSGPYKCMSHPEIILFFRKGDKFSVCPAKDHATTWYMVRSADADTAAAA
jgi:hypothetical protein